MVLLPLNHREFVLLLLADLIKERAYRTCIARLMNEVARIAVVAHCAEPEVAEEIVLEHVLFLKGDLAEVQPQPGVQDPVRKRRGAYGYRQASHQPDRLAGLGFERRGGAASEDLEVEVSDAADGAGHKAMIDQLSLLLVIVVLGISVWRWRQPASVAALLMVAIIPFATIVTINGMFRQSIGIVPFLAAFAAAPLALWWQRSETFSPAWRNASYAGIVAIVGLVAYLNLSFYFDDYRDTPIAQATFGHEITDASIYISNLPDDTVIYFYSGRWSYDYDVPPTLRPVNFGVTGPLGTAAAST